VPNVFATFQDCFPTGEKKFATIDEQMFLEIEENVVEG